MPKLWLTIPYINLIFSFPISNFTSDAEGELTLSAGDYLLVWGSGEPQGGYFDAELLDGRRGLVPASFVQRLIGECLLKININLDFFFICKN